LPNRKGKHPLKEIFRAVIYINKMAMPENECNLLKITLAHYLKLFYFAKKYIPEYFTPKK
jgi:hypothetical protein